MPTIDARRDAMSAASVALTSWMANAIHDFSRRSSGRLLKLRRDPGMLRKLIGEHVTAKGHVHSYKEKQEYRNRFNLGKRGPGNRGTMRSVRANDLHRTLSRRDLATAFAAGLAVKRPPNILLLVADDQRPDTIGALGNRVIRTPNLDRLAREGTAFVRAYCANPICVASRAEILTGCTGFRNGVHDVGKINPELPLWPATMRRAGYHTWYVGKWHSDGKPVQRGYDETQGLYAGGGARWDKPQTDWAGRPATGYRGWLFQTDDGRLLPEHGVGLTPAISSRIADAAVAYIRRRERKPFFLHVNFTAPHDPLLEPPGREWRYDAGEIPLPANFLPEHPFDHGNLRGRDERLFPWPRTAAVVRAELACYYAVISYLDAQIGRILKALEESGQADNTLVVFTSDNGLAIGSHGLRGKQNMYEHSVGVPLIVRGPGVPKGSRSPVQCCLRDLYPTTCELAGVEIPATVHGRSLAPVLSGRAERVYDQTFGYFRNVQRMIRTDRWKLIWYPHLDRYQLFDLDQDPHEMRDLSTDRSKAPLAADLLRRLADWLLKAGDPLKIRL